MSARGVDDDNDATTAAVVDDDSNYDTSIRNARLQRRLNLLEQRAEQQSANLQRGEEEEELDEERQGAELRAIDRAMARDPSLGASAVEFDTVPGVAMRLHYDPLTIRLDPVGDASLTDAHVSPFDVELPTETLDRLLARPYYLCKIDADQQRANNDPNILVLNYKRPAIFATRRRDAEADDRAVPFEPEAEEIVVLFTEHTAIPKLRGKVEDYWHAPNYDAASGILLFRVVPWQ